MIKQPVVCAALLIFAINLVLTQWTPTPWTVPKRTQPTEPWMTNKSCIKGIKAFRFNKNNLIITPIPETGKVFINWARAVFPTKFLQCLDKVRLFYGRDKHAESCCEGFTMEIRNPNMNWREPFLVPVCGNNTVMYLGVEYYRLIRINVRLDVKVPRCRPDLDNPAGGKIPEWPFMLMGGVFVVSVLCLCSVVCCSGTKRRK